jgi:hypothetical protein
MRRGFVIAALIAACVLAGSARGDGDPASDFLLATQVFIPFDMKLPAAKQQELTSLVHDANKSGYKIRVALIGSAYDLGSVTSLWRKPRPYARFLSAEINFIYKQRLLVVMPNGFGFAWPKHASTSEYAVLSKLRVGAGAIGMLDSTVSAVQKLVTASGVKLVRTKPAATAKGGGGFLHSNTFIVLAAVAGVVLLVLLRLALRRKSP